MTDSSPLTITEAEFADFVAETRATIEDQHLADVFIMMADFIRLSEEHLGTVPETVVDAFLVISAGIIDLDSGTPFETISAGLEASFKNAADSDIGKLATILRKIGVL